MSEQEQFETDYRAEFPMTSSFFMQKFDLDEAGDYKDGAVFVAYKMWKRARAQQPVDDYKTWYDEAMIASNESGYAGISAAETIKLMDAEISQLKAQQPVVEQGDLVRYCPGCSSVGEVDYTKHRDCCPDGSLACMVPHNFAEQCRSTFKLAIETITSQQPAQPVAAGWKLVPIEPTNEMTSAMADALEDPENERSSWDLAENMYMAMIEAAPDAEKP